ncbi:MAG: PAS domain S-box protein [Syntrophobacteraceae bacterium]
MSHKPSYEELEKRIKELEKEALMRKSAQDEANVQQETLARVFEVAPYIMMLVDKDCRVTNINDKGVAFLSKQHGGILGLLCGEVFSCLNSLDGLGCGRNEECANCPVRTKIMYTFETGQDICDAEGRLPVRKGSTDVAVDVLISTALVKDRDANKVLVTITDITERKRAEEALRESENKFKSFAEQAITGINIIQDGVFKYVNPKFAQMFGYTVEECLNEMPFKNLVYAEDLATVEEQVGRRVAGEAESAYYTFRGLKKNGQIFHAEIYGSAIVYQGKPATTGTILDITERKRAEKALEESEEKYRELVENANSIIVRMDNMGNVTFFNEFAQSFFGYSAEEILGKNAVGTVVPEFESTTGRDLRLMIEDIAANADRYANNENENMRRNGERVWVAWTNKPVFDENGLIREVLCIGNDITDRKRAEETLHESELRLRTILQTVNEGFWLIDNDTVTKDLNPRMCAILGRNQEEVFGRKIFDFVDSENKAIFEQQMRLRAQGEVGTYEIALSRPDGSNVFCLFNSTPLFDGSGNKVGSFAMVTDISKRKRIEEALRRSQRQLADIIEFLPDATFIINNEGTVIGWNRAMEAMSGVSKNEMIGKGDFEYALPFYGSRRPVLIDLLFANEARKMEYYDSVAALGDGIVAESYVPETYGGKGAYLWGVATALFDEQGNVTGAIQSIRDITDRKRAQDELFNSRQMLRTVLDNIPQRVFWKDRNSIFVGCNKPFALDCGYEEPGEIVGKTSYETASATIADLYHADDREVIESGRPKLNYEEPQIRLDGSRAWLITSKVPMYDQDGQVTGVLGTYEDITERKRAEDALQESEERYRIVFEGSSHGILAADIETKRFVFANPSICHMLGYTENELLDLGIEDIHPKDSLNLVLSELESQLRGEKKLASALPCLRKDGTVFFADVAAELTSIHGRKLTVGFFSDVTERKMAREQIESIARFLDENPDPIFRISRDGKLLYANRSSATVLKSLGWKPGETITGDWRQHALETLSSGCSKEMELTCEELVYSLMLVPLTDLGYLNIYGHDITEQKQAQESLRDNEAMYRTLVENIPQKVFMKDADSFYVSINEHFARDLGIQSADVFGKTDYDFFPGELADKYRADDKRVMKTGAAEELEEHYVSQGKEVWIQTVKTPVRDVSGKIVGVFGTFWDITERKQAEEALSLRESYLTAILENQPGLVWLKDKESRFLAVNETFARTCSVVRPEEVLGKTDLDIWPRELAEKYRNDDKEVLTTGAPIAVEEVINDRGEVKWFETFKTPVLNKDGQILGTSGYARDITERKRAEEALRESEELYRTLVNLSPDAISVADLNGLLTFTSPKAMQMFGDSPDDQILGRSLLCWVAPEEHEKVSTNIMHLMTEGTLTATEYTLVKKDGTRFIGEVNAAVIHSPDGSPMRMIVITRDVTERKRAEEALRLSERRLRRAEVVACFGNWEFIRGCDKVKASEGAKIIYGLEGSEWSIAEVQRISLAEYRGMLDKALNGLIEEGKPYNVEFKIRRPSDGKIIDIHSIAEYSHEKGVVFGVIQDISERRERRRRKRNWRLSCFKLRRWNRWDGWPAAWRTISTTCLA